MAARNSSVAREKSIDTSDEYVFDDGGNEAPEKETIIDPATLFGSDHVEDNFARDENGNVITNKDGSPRKKRGRKAGSSNSGKTSARNSQVVNGVETLAQSLMVVHIGIASLTKFDEFALSEIEANNLSKSVVTVMTEFDIAPDPRIVAVTGLVTTAGMIYGPRLYNFSEHRAKIKKEKEMDTVIEHTFNNTNHNDIVGIGTSGFMRGN